MSASLRKPSPEEPGSALRKIPIRENGEPLIDPVERYPELYWVPRHPVFEYRRVCLAREGIAERLSEAASRLPRGLRLGIVEAWRPPSIQRQMYAETRKRIEREHPDWSPAHRTRLVNRFSAPPDRAAPPPHTTGGAVDVHLVGADGEPLDFVSPYRLTDVRGATALVKGLSEQAEANRALLREIMGSAGFTNYPSEWWHWSCGDQGWAYRGGHPEAVYGLIEPPELAGVEFTLHPHAVPGF